ncbi:MAG: M28 family peptidase [Bacteroidetes bacterium]|nr:M28 family peptidase [Bacteroidota bacterium]MBT4968139.1 M28 family peptidase [Bacteroidota bacterium]MBT6834639.1 M28 family peptidase [Bacteroidota bacterium]
MKFFYSKLPFLIAFLCLTTACNTSKVQTNLSDVQRIEKDLTTITKTKESRDYLHVETLDFVAQYIYNEFAKNCDTVFFQSYQVEGKTYKNVIGRINTDNPKKIVCGAHYDVCGEQEGADDNGSGIVGILELSRIIPKASISYQLEFVAYTLEEPPFFNTQFMGSYVHAKSLYDQKELIEGMICLEMIGYFDDAKNSQDYPLNFLKFIYGNKGDFITIVQKFGNGKFGRKFKRKMKSQHLLKTKSFKAPASMAGIDLSDHYNYWDFGYSALMITNTAFNRNKNYHRATDKMETLDLNRMKLVIDEVCLSLVEF